jgi:hypothetical protein
MKTIQQLQKAARRLLRLKRKFEQIADKGRRGGHELTDDAIGLYYVRVIACENRLRILALELFNRKVGALPVRDARPLKVQRQLGLIPGVFVS